MVIKSWQEALDENLPHPKQITREMVEAVSRQTRYTAYCGARIAMGRIYTSEEIEERRRKALKRSL